MNLLLQEKIRHSYFVCVNLNLDKYYVCTFKPQDELRDTESIFYENIFDLWGSRLNSAENNAISLMHLVKNDEKRKGKILERTKRTVVVEFTSWSSDTNSRYYHLYCKYTLIKQKPWHWQICNAWGRPIVDPPAGQTTDYKELDIVKTTYKTQFDKFKKTVDIRSLEMFNADAERLKIIWEDLQFYIQNNKKHLVKWMHKIYGWK